MLVKQYFPEPSLVVNSINLKIALEHQLPDFPCYNTT